MTVPSNTTIPEKREKIDAAIRKLPLLEGKEVLRHSAVGMLCGIDGDEFGIAARKFCMVGRTRTLKELQRIARQDSDLEIAIGELHQPAILALAEHGFCRGISTPPDKIREAA